MYGASVVAAVVSSGASLSGMSAELASAAPDRPSAAVIARRMERASKLAVVETQDDSDGDEVTEFERLSQKHADAKRLREERAERDRLSKEHGLAPDDPLITQAIEEARALDET